MDRGIAGVVATAVASVEESVALKPIQYTILVANSPSLCVALDFPIQALSHEHSKILFS